MSPLVTKTLEGIGSGLRHSCFKVSSGRFIALAVALLIWYRQAESGNLSGEFNGGLIALALNWYYQKRRQDEDQIGK